MSYFICRLSDEFNPLSVDHITTFDLCCQSHGIANQGVITIWLWEGIPEILGQKVWPVTALRSRMFYFAGVDRHVFMHL